jgi:hypothetical protein
MLYQIKESDELFMVQVPLVSNSDRQLGDALLNAVLPPFQKAAARALVFSAKYNAVTQEAEAEEEDKNGSFFYTGLRQHYFEGTIAVNTTLNDMTAVDFARSISHPRWVCHKVSDRFISGLGPLLFTEGRVLTEGCSPLLTEGKIYVIFDESDKPISAFSGGDLQLQGPISFKIHI